MSISRTYELVYVLKPDVSEQQIADLHTQVEQIVVRMGGTLGKSEAPLAQGLAGRRRLAYAINHHKEGIYVLDLITGSGELIKELDRRLKNVDLLLRHLIVRVDAEERKVDRAQTKRRDESRRRRVARGLPPDRQPGEGPPSDDGDEGGDYDGVEAER